MVNDQGERRLEMARWGLISSWATPDKIPPTTFNARDDSLETNQKTNRPSMWSPFLNRQRCLVPANGFYEWKRDGKARVPYFIHRKDNSLFAFAGLFNRWHNRESGETITTFTIITTSPNSLMAQLHDRMPIILPDPEVEAVWIDPKTDFEGVRRHGVSTEWPDFTMHRVSSDVNATQRDRYVNEPRMIDAAPS